MPDFQYLGGGHGKGLLESALAQPAQTFSGRYLYRTVFDKASILLCSMVKNHPFLDGNKRMGLTTTMVFLILNRYLFYAPTDEAVEKCVAAAEGRPEGDFSAIAKWLRARTLSFEKFRSMSVEDKTEWLGSAHLLQSYVDLRLSSVETLVDQIEGELAELDLP